MKTLSTLAVAIIIVLHAHCAQRFAAPNGAHIAPYDTWAKAATNIQHAINAATDGDVILISNGVYHIATHILVTNAITLRGLNGAGATIVAGTFPATSNRCVYLGHQHAGLDGITLSNGAAFNEDEEEEDERAYGHGGGVFCVGGSVRNCTIVGCRALFTGAGIYARDTFVSNCIVTANYIDAQNDSQYGAGICCGDHSDGSYDLVTNTSVIIDSDIRYNAATNSEDNAYVGMGGGVYLTYGSQLINSAVRGNAAGMGGGVAAVDGGVMAGSRIVGNSATMGGGVFVWAVFAYAGTNLVATQTIISNNTATTEDGGGVFADYATIALRNCLIAANSAAGWGGGIMCNGGGVIENCTITKNRAEGVAGISAGGLALYNTIVYSNISDDVTSEDNDYMYAEKFSHCCAHPDVREDELEEGFGGNIAQNPQFVDYAAGDFRLAGSSPCINSGTNLPWMGGATDLDGTQRILTTFVDIGAYEQAPTGTIIRLSRLVLDFGDVAVGEGAQMGLAVANPGLGVLAGGVALSGGDVFSISGSPNFSLSTFQSATIAFTFAPTNEGEFSSSAQFTSSPGAEIYLSGYGVPEPGLALLMLGAALVCYSVRPTGRPRH